MEDDLVGKPVVVRKEEINERAQVSGAVDVERRHPPSHPEGGKQPEKTIDMVAVDMGDEDRFQLAHRHVETDHLGLDSLPCVHKEQAPMHL